MAINIDRLTVANDVLRQLDLGIWFSVSGSYLKVNWQDWYAKRTVTKRWMCQENFYPPYRFPTTGGTHTVAIANLAAWIRGKKCYPLDTWRYWCGKSVGMKPATILETLKKGGYPDEAICGHCGDDLYRNWDWYGKDGIGCKDRSKCAKYKQKYEN